MNAHQATQIHCGSEFYCSSKLLLSTKEVPYKYLLLSFLFGSHSSKLRGQRSKYSTSLQTSCVLIFDRHRKAPVSLLPFPSHLSELQRQPSKCTRQGRKMKATYGKNLPQHQTFPTHKENRPQTCQR